MSEMQVIHSALEGAARRRRWAHALRGLWVGLLIGAIISLLLISIYHLKPMPLWTLQVAALAPFPCLLIGALLGAWRKPRMAEVARWVDSRQKLQERLSTALEVSAETDAKASSWVGLVLTDAARHAKAVDPKRLMPFNLPKFTRWALVLLALAAGLGFVPEYRSKVYLQKKADEQNIKETGRLLAELTRHNLEKRTPIEPEHQKAIEKVEKLGDQLTQKTLTRSDALKDLANVAEQMKEQLKDLGKDPALKRLEQAARNPTGSDRQSVAGLQKQIEALQKQMGTPVGNPDAMDKLKQALDKLQEAAKGAADKNSPGADAQKQKLGESLSALSKQVQDLGMNLPELNQAIEALAANQTDLVLKDLEAATKDLDKMREMAKTMQQLQQQVEKQGKDLAEQLKNGQPELAKQTLQKMINELKQSNLSQEQLQKMMNEVSKAVDPANNYGEVAKHLKSAAQQMQQSDKQSAGQSLAKAADELDKLMQQMGDAQQLQAELDALKEASQAIGTGQCWGRGSQPGEPRFGPGGKPGSGVGTWADEDGSWDGTSTAGWDNSGVERRDLDGRGHTDRGEGEMSDALKPTKVPGQFSPGGQMPSITLKGVSIKGQSKVAYEEAAGTAQLDAQSALSHDKVPRAYQGAVKDYFDDLKK
jgi:hypothetical protein